MPCKELNACVNYVIKNDVKHWLKYGNNFK